MCYSETPVGALPQPGPGDYLAGAESIHVSCLHLCLVVSPNALSRGACGITCSYQGRHACGSTRVLLWSVLRLAL